MSKIKNFKKISAAILSIVIVLLCLLAAVYYKDNYLDVDNSSNSKGQQSDIEAKKISYVHFSFDDVEKSFNNLATEEYDSLWEEPFFLFLYNRHKDYGAKFSLYSYNDVLANVTDKYKEEFAAASDWLKIGLHAENSRVNYANATYEEGKAAWTTFLNHIERITGTKESVDRMPRLHYFAGTKEALLGMRDADKDYGAFGFIASDGIRDSYYLNSDITNYLYENDHITDNANNLTFVSTDIRLDWIIEDKSDYTHHNFTENTVLDELNYRYNDSIFDNSLTSYIVFAHEWKFYNGTAITNKTHLESFFEFTEANDLDYDFPQKRVYTPTDTDISVDEK